MSPRSDRVAANVFDIDAQGNNAESNISLVAVFFTDTGEKKVASTASAGVPFPREQEELPEGVHIKDNRRRYPAIEFNLAEIAPEVVRIKVVARTPAGGELLRQVAFSARKLPDGQSYAFENGVRGVRLITFTRDEAGWSYTIDLPPQTW